MDKKLVPGASCTVTTVVERKHLAKNVGSGLVSVFSTAMMIAGMESAAVGAVQELLEPGKTTVGVHIDVSHEAPTPEGMKVEFTAKLTSISANGKGLAFAVEARDECGLIGRGVHNRVIIDQSRFEARAAGKTGCRDNAGSKN